MKKDNVNPIELARELCFSINNSNEYRALMKSEEEMLNDKVASSLINSMKEKQKQYMNEKYTNSENVEIILLGIHEIQEKIDDNRLIQSYSQAKKDYDKLLKNIQNIIDYMTGGFKLINSNNRCCGKCHSNCYNCTQ